MEDFLLLVGFAGFAAVMLWLMSLFRYNDALQRTRSLAALAERCGGRLVGATRGGRGWIEITVRGLPGRVRTFAAGEDDRGFTRIEFQWTSPGRLHLAPESILARIGKWFGSQDLQLGDADFDPAFLIRGGPEPWVRKMLDARARAAILKLARACDGQLRVDAGPTGLRIEMARDLVDDSFGLLEAIRGAEALVGGWIDASTGMAIEAPAEEIIAAGRCPVCAEPLAEPLRRCERCKTAHHRECWKYFGACAVYGCESEANARVRSR